MRSESRQKDTASRLHNEDLISDINVEAPIENIEEFIFSRVDMRRRFVTWL